jgi:hypothetical protein
LTGRFNGLLFRIKAISTGPVLNVRNFRFLRLFITARCAYWIGGQLAWGKEAKGNTYISLIKLRLLFGDSIEENKVLQYWDDHRELSPKNMKSVLPSKEYRAAQVFSDSV